VIFLVQSHAALLRYSAPIAAVVLAFLLVFGLVGGWFLAGRMLAPLTRITDATRVAASGSLTTMSCAVQITRSASQRFRSVPGSETAVAAPSTALIVSGLPLTVVGAERSTERRRGEAHRRERRFAVAQDGQHHEVVHRAVEANGRCWHVSLA
jgi:hypothetical protein